MPLSDQEIKHLLEKAESNNQFGFTCKNVNTRIERLKCVVLFAHEYIVQTSFNTNNTKEWGKKRAQKG